MSSPNEPFDACALRPGYPDFVDLPWRTPLREWHSKTDRLEALPAGESRHDVVFVNFQGHVYALKALAPGAAAKEYDLLRQMQALRLPTVEAVGHVSTTMQDQGTSVLITRYLDHSLPYHSLFLQDGLTRYRTHLLDALAGLLVQLHVAGVYWGDCSLFNTLFLRDAGTLRAYLVDAETSEVLPQISDAMRAAELDVMEENVSGALLDLVALGALSPDYPALATAQDVRRRYEDLWREVTREEVVSPSNRYRIEERVRALNALGFSVGEIEMSSAGEMLRFRVLVTDRNFHRDRLHSLTGLEVQEMQARQMMNEIHQVRAERSEQENRSLSLSGAAYHWLREIFRPISQRLATSVSAQEPAELYCELLDHKWYLSEQASRDVGIEAAVTDFLQRQT